MSNTPVQSVHYVNYLNPVQWETLRHGSSGMFINIGEEDVNGLKSEKICGLKKSQLEFF